jgi:abelson tyrosine-protein kinase 1
MYSVRHILNPSLLTVADFSSLYEEDNIRPPIPKTRTNSAGLTELLKVCWHRDPFKRPSFSRIVKGLKTLRTRSGVSIDIDEGVAISPRFGRVELEMGGGARESPDMKPVPLPLSPTATTREYFTS